MPRRKRNMWARFTQAVTDFWFKVKFTRVTFRVYLMEDDYLYHKYDRHVRSVQRKRKAAMDCYVCSARQRGWSSVES